MCNGSVPHVSDIGALLTYSCTFKYRGNRVEPIVWAGPGVTKDNVHHNIDQSTEEIHPECFQGKQRLIYNTYM